VNNSVLPFEEPIQELDRRIEELKNVSGSEQASLRRDIKSLETKRTQLLESIYANLSAWDRVQVARHPNRPTALDYFRMMLDDFMQLHGDRLFRDDRALVCGMGRMGAERVVLIAHQRGRDTREKLACNFGMPHPEGYRKARRVMGLAEKFHLPVVTLVDTMGAYPGIASEERGVACAIAENLMVMSRLRTPIMCVVVGEGGSGGALGVSVGDRLAMLEYSYYSVISPEGCAAILWRSGANAKAAAQALRLTAPDLLGLGVIDSIIPEPTGGAHRAPDQAAATLKKVILATVQELKKVPIERLLENRYRKYRRIGVFRENGRQNNGSVLALPSATGNATRS